MLSDRLLRIALDALESCVCGVAIVNSTATPGRRKTGCAVHTSSTHFRRLCLHTIKIRAVLTDRVRVDRGSAPHWCRSRAAERHAILVHW